MKAQVTTVSSSSSYLESELPRMRALGFLSLLELMSTHGKLIVEMEDGQLHITIYDDYNE